jgi:hypothetical protein
VTASCELLVGYTTDEIVSINAVTKLEAFDWPTSRTNRCYTTYPDKEVVLDWARKIMVQNAMK